MTENYGNDEAILAAIERTSNEIGGLREEVAEQRTFGRQSRRHIYMIWALATVDVIMSVITFWAGFTALNAAQEAKHATGVARSTSATLGNLCESGNDQRRNQRALWEKVIALSESGREFQSPEQQERTMRNTAEFRAYMDQAFAIRDCKAVTAIPERK